ncbi:MAG: CotH kinase family protein, partial [Gammaproteobacteria bacterium]
MLSRYFRFGILSVAFVVFSVNSFAQDGGYQLFLTEVMASNGVTLADEDGDYEDWIELVNFSGQTINLSGVGLSDDPDEPFKWTFGNVEIAPFEFLVVFASGKDRALHTNFKISASGEDLSITAPGGTTLDSFFTGEMRRDTSRGRGINSEPPIQWPYFLDPTPGAQNATQWYLGYAEQPEISVESGVKTAPFTVTAAPINSEDQLFYTLDGSIPTADDTPVTGAIEIGDSTVLRVQAIRDDYIVSRPTTAVYYFGETGNLPVLTVATDPDLLFDPITGAYMPGPNPGEYPWFFGANFRDDIEVPVHFTMFESDGETVVDMDAGLELHGGLGRILPKKGLKIKARERLGGDEIDYQLFPEKDLDSFSTILLRASSQDQYETLFRDAFQQSLLDVTSLDYQPARSVALYINTEYWGIYNIRETATPDYINDNYGLDDDEIDFIENSSGFYKVRAGSWFNFQSMWEYLLINDLAVAENYEQIKTMIDIDYILDYFAAEIYVGNIDWPDNNIRWWRPTAEGGKWRTMVFDLDSGFRLDNVFQDTLAYATNDQELLPDVPVELSHNPPESTFILRSLLRSDEFRDDFIRRMTDMMNIVYHPQRVIGKVNEYQLNLWDEMPAEIERWWLPTGFPLSIDTWLQQVHEMRIFSLYRPVVMEQFMAQKFGLTTRKNVTVQVVPADSGGVQVNSQAPTSYPYSGDYFTEVDLELTALPAEGYVFVGWSGVAGGSETNVSLDLNDDMVITARFQEIAPQEPPTIVFNEINYNSADAFDAGDWVELHNFGATEVDLSGWAFKDLSDIEDDLAGFELPAGTVVEPGGYVVLCDDPVVFDSLYPGVSCIGGFDYGLGGGGDFIALFDAQDTEID